MPAEWAIAFAIGLVSSTHCLGMCGGIAGGLTYSLSPAIRQQPHRLLLYKLAYNGGRIGSYMIAGAALAGGAGMLTALAGAQNRLIMATVGAAFLVAVGLHIGGWFPRFARVESLGRPFWRLLEPLGRRLLPVERLYHATAFGLVWGWLPCGLVYSALVYSLTTESVLRGALFMGFFGLGTMPMMLTVGIMASTAAAHLRRPWARRVAGLAIVVLAPVPLFVAY